MSRQEAVSAEWDAMAGEWDDLAAGYSKGFAKLLWEHTGLGDKSKDLVVLDFGCGTGLLTEELRNRVSQVVCIDAAPQMVKQLQEKIRAGDWQNVRGYCAVLSDRESHSQEVREILHELEGQVDLIVASSVLSFVPEEDISETMKVLSKLLRPGGLLCHSDWPKSDKHPDGFTSDRAKAVYKMADLKEKSTMEVSMEMGKDCTDSVFVGVACK